MSGLGLPGGLPLSGKWQSRTTTGFARLQFAGDGVTSLTPAASASVRSRSSPRVGGTCCSSSGASVSAALARTLARPAKAVVRVVCVESLRRRVPYLPGEGGRVNRAYRSRRAASSLCRPQRSPAQVWEEVQVALERQPRCGMSAGWRPRTHRGPARRARASHGPAFRSVSRRRRFPVEPPMP